MFGILKTTNIHKQAPIMIAALLTFAPPALTQNARIYVEVRVVNDDESGHERAYQTALSFINALDIEQMKTIKPPASGYIAAPVLLDFLPPPLQGAYGYAETVEGPEIKDDMLVPYAHVKYFRGETTWDEITIDIMDVGSKGKSQMRNMHLSSRNREHTDSTVIRGCDATVYRTPFAGGGHEVQIALLIPAGQIQIDWLQVSIAAMAGTQHGVKTWSSAARFTDGKINGPTLFIPAGSLTGPNFEGDIINAMMAQDVPVEIAQAFAAPVWSGWENWMVTFNIPSFPAFPSFAAYAGPVAPPTPAVPIPLLQTDGDRESLRAGALKTEIMSRLEPWKNDRDAHEAVERFTEWLDAAFTEAIIKSRIENLMGEGPVPTYAPPQVPMGPVVDGNILPSPGCFANLKF
jgi:hypothetical protein